MPRREREKAVRRQAILSAAERVFAAHGFDAATMEQIAEEAEYATGTIYLYFRDKNALYAALLAGKLSTMVDEVENAAAQAGKANPAAALRGAIRAQFEFHDRERPFFEVLMRHHKGPPPAGGPDWELIEQTLKRHHAVLVGLIRHAQKQKIIRAGDPLEFAMALLGMIIHLTMQAMRGKTRPLVEKTDFVQELFLNGAGIKTGKK